jgi:hypothetical protein
MSSQGKAAASTIIAAEAAAGRSRRGRRASQRGDTGMFRAFPLLIIAVIVYAIFGFAQEATHSAANAAAKLAAPFFNVPMPMNSTWTVSIGDLMLILALVLLFFELVRATNARRVEIINHSLSLIVFIICLVAFLLFPGFQTTVFFLITLMTLMDVLAGFIVTIVSSRREIDVA